MKMIHLLSGLALAGTTAAAMAGPTIAQLVNVHRILIVSGPAGSREVAAQRRTLAAWRRQGAERDIATIYLDGPKVDGVSDAAAAIRARYAIPAGGFAVALVGKDGHVAYRSAKPVTGSEFEQTIDAMPMRRAGQR